MVSWSKRLLKILVYFCVTLLHFIVSLIMAETIIEVLSNNDCTLEDIKTALQNTRNIEIHINEETTLWGWEWSPLSFALIKDKSMEILKEIISCGADVHQPFSNKKMVQFECFSQLMSIEPKHLDVLKLLLDYKTNINGETLASAYFRFILNASCCSNVDLLLPMLQVTISHMEMSTKTDVFHKMFESAMRYPSSHCYEAQHTRNYFIELVTLVLEAGARPTFQDVMRDLAVESSRPNSQMNIFLVTCLLRVILPYIFVQNYCKGEKKLANYNYMLSDIDRMLSLIRQSGYYASEILLQTFKDILIGCITEVQHMQSDRLENNITVIEILSDSCVKDAGILSNFLHRISKDKYPYFKELMSSIVKSGDMIGLYSWLAEKHVGRTYVVNYDCFHYISKYLSTNDIFNFCLALITENQDNLNKCI